MKIQIARHPKALLFENEKNSSLIIKHALDEISSDNMSTSEGVRDLFRQVGFVNLWFFLKFIAGYSGPFDKLNNRLHVDMCNFKQSTMYDGCRAAAFIGRKHYKSTIFTMGGNAWELLRNPDLVIGLFSSIIDRAQEFLHTTQRIFDSNELFAWLYPEYVPEEGQKRWNDTEMVLPNRSKYQTGASIKPIAASGSTQGIHVDLADFDDIIGDKQLTSNRQSSAEMYRITNWFTSSIRTLLTSWKVGRIMLVGTRYAVDDTYEGIMKNVKRRVGYWDELPYREDKEEGEWDVYYRMAVEKGEIIFPEVITQNGLRKIAEEDYWTYSTQYLNNPSASGMAEFNGFTIKQCEIDYDDSDGWMLFYFHNGRTVEIPLSDCDLVFAIDPAASERYISAKTSRTALVALARTHDNKRFIIDIKADYVAPSTWFDWIFAWAKKYKNHFRATYLEAQGAFKIFKPLLYQEERRRNEGQRSLTYLHLNAVTKTGDKDAFIRCNLEPVLTQGQLYCAKHCMNLLNEEMRGFPQSQKKDILDALSLAESKSIQPYEPGEDERERERIRRDRYRNNLYNVTGY